jgi:hypothetical protein
MPFFARGFPRISRDSPGFAVAQGKRLGTLRVASTAGRRLIEVPANGPGRKTWISRPVVQHGELNIKKKPSKIHQNTVILLLLRMISMIFSKRMGGMSNLMFW